MGYFLPRRWRNTFPRGKQEVDWRHPFSDDLHFLTIPALHGVLDGARATFPSQLAFANAAFTPTQQDIIGRPRGLALASIVNASLFYALAGWGARSNYTLAFLGANPASAGGRVCGMFYGDESGSPFTQCVLTLNGDKGLGNSSGKFALAEYSGGLTIGADSASTAVDGKDHLYAGVREGSTATLFLDGEPATATQTSTASTVTLAATSYIGPGTQNGGKGPAATIACWAWRRSQTADMLRQLNEYPWQMLRAWGARIYFDVAAAPAGGKPHHYYAQMRA